MKLYKTESVGVIHHSLRLEELGRRKPSLFAKSPSCFGFVEFPLAVSPSSAPAPSRSAVWMMLYAFDISATFHLSGFLGQDVSTRHEQCWVDTAFQRFKGFWVWLNPISKQRLEGKSRGPGRHFRSFGTVFTYSSFWKTVVWAQCMRLFLSTCRGIQQVDCGYALRGGKYSLILQ